MRTTVCKTMKLRMIFVLMLSVLEVSANFCSLYFPKSYVIYHLRSDEFVEVDGKLEEEEWQQVGWTERFVDIQGPLYPVPRFETRVKMRWDDTFLYIGAYMEETDVWANQTKHNSIVFHDNDFEVFVDPDGSTHMYKELEVNAINTTWDLMLTKPYINGGQANSSWEMPSMKYAAYVDGPVNDPRIQNKYWTAELALPLKDLADGTAHTRIPPKDGDQWRINFSRVEWHVHVVDGHYEKVVGLREDNWVWSPQYSINMHLPERWGFIQFANYQINETVFTKPKYWPVYVSLVDVYDAEKEFFAINGYFTTNLTQLSLHEFVRQGKCSGVPVVSTTDYAFNATVSSLGDHLIVGHIRDDRLIWFDPL
ncbi:uncharacterized protein LOC134179493 [Corticium candelabrum]|uniref:uncharacterized protein LOC134179493 n=1 Tax=Corticium candelabrum TaxID=121492 RepID=UPI002E257AAE|nr:uncharacterized protein LOC134179493 [Corticium candelabrum]